MPSGFRAIHIPFAVTQPFKSSSPRVKPHVSMQITIRSSQVEGERTNKILLFFIVVFIVASLLFSSRFKRVNGIAQVILKHDTLRAQPHHFTVRWMLSNFTLQVIWLDNRS